MRVIRNDKCIFFDVDDTLVMWDNKYKKYNDQGEATNTKHFVCYEMQYELVPHTRHIEYLKDSKIKNKNTIVVWSAGGWEWAEEVVKVLELEKYVDAVMSKPDSYVDDLDCKEWMGKRLYKDVRNE